MSLRLVERAAGGYLAFLRPRLAPLLSLFRPFAGRSCQSLLTALDGLSCMLVGMYVGALQFQLTSKLEQQTSSRPWTLARRGSRFPFYFTFIRACTLPSSRVNQVPHIFMYKPHVARFTSI